MSEIFREGRTAVVTGAALGIGRATALRCAAQGMRVALIDLPSDDLEAAAAAVAEAGSAEASMTCPASVADAEAMADAAARVAERYGPPALLMNNAVTRTGGGVFAARGDWRAAFEVNFWGVLNGVAAFAPAMLESGHSGAIVNVGSKQGITNPPGNAAYNVTKSAVKTYTEALQHELRNRPGCSVSAHLLVPGWTTTAKRAHQPGAWLPEQVVERLLEGLARGSFYIVCPDGEVTEAMDRKRILWAAGDITEDRPALSRWHGGYDAEFERFEP